MYFLDNSAHIFELPDYSRNPIGYEYDEQDYIFWFEDQNDNTRLSVNNYYGKVINVLFELPNIKNIDETSISLLYDIEITCDSENFKLIKAEDFQESINEQKSIIDFIDIDNQSKVLNSDDILIIKITQENKNYIMIPIYLIGTSKYSGTWLTNVLIHITNKFDNIHTYCPITIGGIFNDEYESLVIHGQNMGIKLPKEILKAINGTDWNSKVFDEELYNKKIKEYLLNYMNIKGELGNYNSTINSLKWFGYQDSIELYKLLETDNEFQTQYVRDYFDISQDIIQAFNQFLNSQFIGLQYKLNTELVDENNNILCYPQNIDMSQQNRQFWGEGLPILINNDDKYIMVNTNEYLGEKYGDDCQQFKYLDKYVNYSIYNLMFKLSYLKYYYQTYFLPIFILLKNLNIEHKVYTTANKYLTYSYDHLYENIINTQDKSVEVIFNNDNVIYFTHQNHFVDENFNKFENNNEYEINDTCLFIPISFKYNKGYNCILIIKDDDFNQIIYKSIFSFINSENNKYLGFVFYPKLINELYTKLYTYINKSYTIYLNANDKWYTYNFVAKLPELDVHIGTLEYKYWVNDINYFNEIYHTYTSKNENGELLKDQDGNYINNTKILFLIHNKNKADIKLDITSYIEDKDFFDNPTKYFSKFSQIDKITNDQVYFNTYMHDPDFIYINDSEFGLYEKKNENRLKSTLELSIKNDINELINRHQSKINILNNYKYLNNIHMYYLYKRELKEQYDILRYKQNLSILCKNILIEKPNNGDNQIIFTKLSNASNSSIDTNNNYSQYLLEHSNSYLKENQSYYFILERSINGLLTGNNTNSLYSYYNDNNSINNIGYIICPIENNELQLSQNKLSEYDYNFNDGFDISKLSIQNNNIYYQTDNYNYDVLFTFTPLIKSNNSDSNSNKYEPYNSLNTEYDNNIQIYGQLKLFYYEKIKVLNIFGYYDSKYCSEIDDTNPNNLTCTVNIKGQIIDNVKLYPSAQYVEYSDIYNNQEVIINELNPSLYWETIDTLENSNDINTFLGFEMYHNEDDLESVEQEINNQDIEYINYLCQDLTGLKGTYVLNIEYNNQNDKSIVRLITEVTDKNGKLTKYNNLDKSTFILYGDENKVITYLKFYNVPNLFTNDEPKTITPHIYFSITEDKEVKYNQNESILNIYKKFFYKKYTISLYNRPRRESLKEIWDSYIQFDEDNNYDTYLMHGKDSINNPNEYWYFMFISKNTCDDAKILKSSSVYPQEIEFEDYVLKHVTTKQLFLINRMRVNYVDNIYHFNGNEMIVCSLWNNKMLPTNTKISSKWTLKPISHGANTNNIIYANTNTAIISVPNSNTYDKGYYNIQVNYSLDGNVLNSKTITKKILIK